MTVTEVLCEMDFEIVVYDSNSYGVFDLQRNEYINSKFTSIRSIVEELELYIQDYWFRPLEDELNELGIEYTADWEGIYKTSLVNKSKFKYNIDYCLDVCKCFVNPELFESI